MKRRILLITVLLIALGLSACQYGSVEDVGEKEPVIAFIAGVGTVDDGSFNDSIVKGMQKAVKEVNRDLKILESKDDAALEKNLDIALELKPEAIFVSSLMTDQVFTAALENPEIKFVIIDGAVEDMKRDGLPKNFLSVNFDNAEGAFLMGVLSAASNAQGTAEGFVAGMDITPVNEMEYGFKAGVKAVAPSHRVLTETIDTFGDNQKGAEAAKKLREQGVGVVFAAAGGSNEGILKDAVDNGYWSVGVDQDQALVYPQLASKVLCSMVKNVDIAAYNEVKAVGEGHFEGGIKHYGVGNGGIILGGGSGNVTQEMQALYDKWRKEIVEKRIVVPKTEEQLQQFNPPTL